MSPHHSDVFVEERRELCASGTDTPELEDKSRVLSSLGQDSLALGDHCGAIRTKYEVPHKLRKRDEGGTVEGLERERERK